MKKITSNKWAFLAFIWFIGSIYILFIKVEPQPSTSIDFDRVSHFGLFFGQTWLIIKIFFSLNQLIPIFKLLLSAIFWAIICECIATLLFFHHNTILNILTDCFGIVTALILGVRVQTARIHYRNK